MENSTDAMKALVDRYLTRDYHNPLAESEAPGMKFQMLKCLDMYHSVEAQQQVEKFVLDPDHTYRQDENE